MDADAVAIWSLECRHVGQVHALDVVYSPRVDTTESVRERFLAEHRRLFGVGGDAPVEVVSANVTLARPSREFSDWWPAEGLEHAGGLPVVQHVLLEGGDVEVITRDRLAEGASGVGPALIALSSTGVRPSGASWEVDRFGSLVVATGVAA